MTTFNLAEAGSNAKPESKDSYNLKRDEKTKEEEENKFSEGLTYLKRGIFNYSKKKKEITERFELSPQEYLDKYRINIYLQDVLKFIIERKDEKPSEVLSN